MAEAIITITLRAVTILVTTKTGGRVYYWVRQPEGMSEQRAVATQPWQGPFKTEAQMHQDQRRIMLGPDVKVIEGGAWDPNWEKPQ
jgi:hypothetical protein